MPTAWGPWRGAVPLGTATSRASRSRSEGSSLLRRARRCHQQGSSARLPGEARHRGSAPLGGWGLRGAGGAAISPSAAEVLQAAVWEEAGAAVAPAPALLPSRLPLTAWCPPCSAAAAPPGPQRLWPAAGAERCPLWRGCEQPAPLGQPAAWGCSGAGVRGAPLHLGFSPGSCRSETLGARRVGVVLMEVGWLWMGCGGRAGLPRLVRVFCGCAGDTSRAPEPLPWPGRSWGCLQASGRNVTAAFCSPYMGGEQAGPGPQPHVPAAAPCVGLRGAGWAVARGCGGHGAARPISRPTGAARPQAL